MSISGPYRSANGRELVAPRNAEVLHFNANGGVTDLALLNITRLAPIDRTNSALSLLKSHPGDPLYRCPKEACAQANREGKCDELPFCGSSLQLRKPDAFVVTMDEDPEKWVQWVEQLRAELERMGYFGVKRVPVSALLQVLCRAGEVTAATELFRASADKDGVDCHARFTPFQRVFAQRCVLPRTSVLAYWGVGTGKTAGAASVLLQAGAAIRTTNGAVHLDAIPVHMWALAQKYPDEVQEFILNFGDLDEAGNWMAIRSQLLQGGGDGGNGKRATVFQDDKLDNKLKKWLAEWDGLVRGDTNDFMDGADELEEAAEASQMTVTERKQALLGQLPIDLGPYTGSLVLLNEVHRMEDATYLRLKAVNMACLWRDDEPGFPPVIAAFTATPCAGGLRGLLMTLDLLNNSQQRAGEVRGMDPGLSPLGNTALVSRYTTEELMHAVGLSLYQNVRVGQVVSFPVRASTLSGVQDATPLISSEDPFFDELGAGALWYAEADDPLDTHEGRVTRVYPGSVVTCDVELPRQDQDPIVVRVPALLTMGPNATESAVQKGRGRLVVALEETANGPEFRTYVVDPANPNDSPWRDLSDTPANEQGRKVIHIQRPLVMIHGPEKESNAFEELLVSEYSPWGQLSYVDLADTQLFPTRAYVTKVVDSALLPEAPFLPELVDVLGVMTSPDMPVNEPAVWQHLRNAAAHLETGETRVSGLGHPLTKSSAAKYPWGNANFYTALLLVACRIRRVGWSAAGQLIGMRQGDPPAPQPTDPDEDRQLLLSVNIPVNWVGRLDQVSLAKVARLLRADKEIPPDLDSARIDQMIGELDVQEARDRDGEDMTTTIRTLEALGLVDSKHVNKYQPLLLRWAAVLNLAMEWAGAAALDFMQKLALEIAPPKLRFFTEQAAVVAGSNNPAPLGYVPYESIVGMLAVQLLMPQPPRVYFWVVYGGRVDKCEPHGTDGGPPVILVSDAAGADDLDSDKFVVDGGRKPNLLAFLTVPPSRQRMVQLEGRLHRHGCEPEELETRVPRTVTFWLLCSGWPTADGGRGAARDLQTALESRARARPLENSSTMSEHTGRYEMSNAWDLLRKANFDERGGSMKPTGNAKTFRDLDLMPESEWSSDARGFMDLQMGVSDFPEFFASLAQQFSIERASGDTDAVGTTVEWVGLSRPPSLEAALEVCNQYLRMAGPQPLGDVSQRASPPAFAGWGVPAAPGENGAPVPPGAPHKPHPTRKRRPQDQGQRPQDQDTSVMQEDHSEEL